MVVSLVNLGRLDYAAALALQEQLCALRQQERIGDVLLLVEHPPVLTLGRNAHREHVVAGSELLARRCIALFETNRGGDVTYHGPGQLVGYPILNLRGFTPPLGIPAQGEHRGVFDQQQHIADTLLLAQGAHVLLQSERRGIIQATEIDQGHDHD